MYRTAENKKKYSENDLIPIGALQRRSMLPVKRSLRWLKLGKLNVPPARTHQWAKILSRS
jgi:hypothetical protein